jgi:hypothetical protein
MNGELPRDDHLKPSAPDLRPDVPHRVDIDLPWDRRWFPRNRGIVRWTRDLGTPAVDDWSQAFTVLHQVQDINWNDGGSSFTPTGELHAAEPQPSWGAPEETAEGWELPFGLRLFPLALNRIDLALVDVDWHDPAFGPPPLMRRHLRPDFFKKAMSSDDMAAAYVIPPFELIWHRRV